MPSDNHDESRGEAERERHAKGDGNPHPPAHVGDFDLAHSRLRW